MDINHYLVLSALLFTVGTVGVIIKRNVIAVFLCIELMLNAANLSFVAFATFLGQVQGQVIVFLVMVVAAAEAAVGLAITVALYRNRNTLSIDETDTMKW
jgi:NADH-quinone oxidoreductase subunit K